MSEKSTYSAIFIPKIRYISYEICIFEKIAVPLSNNCAHDCTCARNQLRNMTEVLKYTLPALIVLATTCIVLWKMLQEDERKRAHALRQSAQKELLPVRLRGYERLALLLERTTPEHMLLDIEVSTLSVRQLHSELTRTIRLEYDHNLSQQIYVSAATWQAIIQVREEMLRFVNTCASRFQPEEPALEFAKQLITIYATNGETPTDVARRLLNDEARQLFA